MTETTRRDEIAAGLAEVEASIAEACRAAGRAREELTLIAVSKTYPASDVRLLAALGVTDVGENRDQEASAKVRECAGLDLTWHFIGQLQTNKVRLIAGIVSVWQSVDRPALATEIAKRAPGATVFLQVNATDEADKGGCPPAEIESLVRHARGVGLVVDGLMTVGPTSQDVDLTRTVFASVRRMADDLGLASCSMGMSGDMDIALANGATHVRIGSALFGPRPHPRAAVG